MFYALMILCLSGNVLAHVYEEGSCPEVQTMAGFEVSKFMGRWYLMLHSVTDAHGSVKCAHQDLSLQENGTISGIDTCIIRETGIMMSVPSITRIPNPAEAAKMKMKGLTLPDEKDYWVLDTDYNSYAFLYNCVNVQSQHIPKAWVFTRNQKPSESTIAKADELIKKYTLRKSSFEKVKQEDCVLRPSK